MSDAVADAAARLTGHAVVGPGGHGAPARVDLDDGTTVVVKQGEGVRAEAAGLRWLAAAGAVAVPAVRGADASWLVSDQVPPGGATAAAAEAFGRELAALHAAGADAFGSPPPGGPVEAWIGMAPMRNVTGATWAPWYAEHRVRPYLRLTVARGAIDDRGARTVEDVCARLDEEAAGGPPEPPARCHGDLWTGNVLWDGERAWVIDPAAHGGHRESDLAMLALFGAPHLARILAAYDEAAPLAAGWRDRVGLHQLFPLLVHAALFGGGYGRQAADAADRALHRS